MCHLEKPNAASKAKHEKARPGSEWEKECEAKRRELGMSMTEEPWTGRPGVFCQGMSAQLSTLNFLHETLNLRWKMLCDKAGLDPANTKHVL